MSNYLKSILPSFSRPRGHVQVRGTTLLPRLCPTAYSTRIAAERCMKAESLVLKWFRSRSHHRQIEIVRRSTRLQGAHIGSGTLLKSVAKMSKHVEMHQRERTKRKLGRNVGGYDRKDVTSREHGTEKGIVHYGLGSEIFDRRITSLTFYSVLLFN